MQVVDEWKVTVTWPDRELDFWLAGNSLTNVIKTASDVRFKPEPDSFKIERIKYNQQTSLYVTNGLGQTVGQAYKSVN